MLNVLRQICPIIIYLDKILLSKANLVVLNYNYNDVGQTKRRLHIRREEHKNNIKLNPKYHNVITKHILENKNTNSLLEIL